MQVNKLHQHSIVELSRHIQQLQLEQYRLAFGTLPLVFAPAHQQTLDQARERFLSASVVTLKPATCGQFKTGHFA
jgi:hypothetical protein